MNPIELNKNTNISAAFKITDFIRQQQNHKQQKHTNEPFYAKIYENINKNEENLLNNNKDVSNNNICSNFIASKQQKQISSFVSQIPTSQLSRSTIITNPHYKVKILFIF